MNGLRTRQDVSIRQSASFWKNRPISRSIGELSRLARTAATIQGTGGGAVGQAETRLVLYADA